MIEQIPVIDLFSGPGGLAEGFSPCGTPLDRRRYKIALSIEKEEHAFNTLVLRAFLRKFNDELPTEYYEFLNRSTPEPDWQKLYPDEWNQACKETQKLELGTSVTHSLVKQEIRKIKRKYGRRVVLVGGPPCQAYSLVGRARTSGIKDYTPGNDPRISLYEQFVNIVSMLEPAIAVMENVKGMISSSFNEEYIFQKVMRRLRDACGLNSYELFALTPSRFDLSFEELLEAPSEFIVHSEKFGIPQARHRVFIVCIHTEIASNLPIEFSPRLVPRLERIPLESVLGAMPKLRSGLSRNDVSLAWKRVVGRAFNTIERNLPNIGESDKDRFLKALELAKRSLLENSLQRTACGDTSFPEICPNDLKLWLYDENLRNLPNNDTRGHMPSDLERYLFASIFAKSLGKTPKTKDFPSVFASNHKSWATNIFSDRFRVQLAEHPAKTITSHIAKDGHYFIHPDPTQCRSLTVREAARLQTFPDNFLFKGNRTAQYVQVGNAVPPFLAHQISNSLWKIIEFCDQNLLLQPMRNSPKLEEQEEFCSEVAL